jgi:hypothetical protein
VWVDTGKVRQKRKLDEIVGIRCVFDEVISPAFRERGWHMAEVANSKENFACIHADCLSWDNYSTEEKAELSAELKKLSSSPKAQLYSKVFSSSLGKPFSSLLDLKKGLIQQLKALYHV